MINLAIDLSQGGKREKKKKKGRERRALGQSTISKRFKQLMPKSMPVHLRPVAHGMGGEKRKRRGGKGGKGEGEKGEGGSPTRIGPWHVSHHASHHGFDDPHCALLTFLNMAGDIWGKGKKGGKKEERKGKKREGTPGAGRGASAVKHEIFKVRSFGLSS